LIEFKNVSFKYTGIGGSNGLVLKDISFSIQPNESVAVIGSSGSGKTTLIQHFTGLLKPESGSVVFEGQNIWEKKYSLSTLRRRIGIVFQFPESQLFEDTVKRDVAFGPRNLGFADSDIDNLVIESLKAVELEPDDFMDRSPFRLSEGEKRRVAIAGVLAMNPDVIIFDEPTAGLDPQGVRKIGGIIQRLLRNGKTVVVVTHNMDFVHYISTRALVLHRGELLFNGEPEKLFKNTDLLQKTGLEVPLFLQARQEIGENLPVFLKNVKNSYELMALIK